MLAKPIRAVRQPVEKGRIFLVDDHPIVRQGLAALINAEIDLEVCGEADGAHDALDQIIPTRAQLVVVDISLKEGNGIDLIKDIKNRHPGVKVIVASMHDEMLFAERALRAGAIGYIGKAWPAPEMLAGLRKALQGKVCVSEAVNRRLNNGNGHGSSRGTNKIETPESPMAKLSNRELTIFELIGQGMTTRDIAAKLFLSVKTVETHREHIKTKLNLANAAELAHHATCWQLEAGASSTAARVQEPA